jgi:hypothetical protein
MPHTSITKPSIVTSIKTTGGGRDLPKGQLAIVKDKAGANGAVVVSDFAGMSKKERIEIRVGRGNLPQGLRAQHVAFEGTGFFPLEGIIDIKGYAPTNVKLEVDALEVGYGGISTDAGLFVPEGKSTVMDIVIHGHPLALFFGQKEHVVTKRVYRKEGQTMQEVVRQLVKDLQNESLPSTMQGAHASITDKLSNYLDISVIDSSAQNLQGTEWKTSTVKIKDAGESNDLAAVEAQYPLYKVVVLDRKDGVTTYSILHLASDTIANAVITEVDVTGKGCADCQAGYSDLTAGVVYHVSLEDNGVSQIALVDDLPGYVAGTVLRIGSDAGKGIYSVVLGDKLTDAEKTTFLATNAIASTAVFRDLGTLVEVCSKSTSESYAWTPGETCFANSEVFNIVLSDNECGESRLTELQTAYSELTIVEGKATGNVNVTVLVEGASGDLSIVVAGVAYDESFDTDKTITVANFVASHASAILTATGATLTGVGAVMTITAPAVSFPTVTAVAGGLTETVSALNLEVQASAGGCKRTYATLVNSNIVCEGCDDNYIQPFYAEIPTEFQEVSWEALDFTFDEDAKMGIKIEGKPFKLVPENYEQDWIPFIETSTKIKAVSFGFREQDYLNFVPAYDVNTEFATVRRIRYAKDVNNLSQSFFGAEEMGRQHYQGETQFKKNLFARANFSQDSLLSYQKRMVQYHIKYQDTGLSQMGGGRSNITHDFMIIVEQGKHQEIETVLNKLAGRLGLENVSITN